MRKNRKKFAVAFLGVLFWLVIFLVSSENLVFANGNSIKFIKDDATGYDCNGRDGNPGIGYWDVSSKVCTLNKDVNETIQISNDNITLDGNGQKVSGFNTGTGIYVTGKNVTIKNIVVSGFTYGISISRDGATISSSTITQNYYGIYVYGSSSNPLSVNLLGNTISFNQVYGIELSYAKNSNISKNIVGPNNWAGLVQFSSENSHYENNDFFGNQNGVTLFGNYNTLSQNKIRENSEVNFYLQGDDMATNEIGSDNTINGKPIYYEKNISDKVYENLTDVGAFYCTNCQNITLKNVVFPEKESQLVFWHTNNSLVEGIDSGDKSTAVALYYSSNNTIKKNTFKSIRVYKSSNENKIYNNNIMTDDSGYTISYGSTGNLFNENLPLGGNYWKSNESKCKDLNNNKICDAQFWFDGGHDDYPWANELDFSGSSNVLFLPGLEASRLYAKDDPGCHFINCENQLWEPNRNDDVEKLYLDKNGKSTDKYDIYTRDVLDEANILPIGQENYYKSFIAKMNDLKNKDKVINDWNEAPYDWRLSLEDILASGKKDGINILYNKSTDSPYIISELKRLAVSSKTGKVTLVAHSNGGLVAKALMQKLGDEETKKLVDKVIFVAVPQVGTPAAIAGLLHGKDQELKFVLNKEIARSLGENMPGAYNLLPSNGYFSLVQTPVVKFNINQNSDLYGRYDEEIDSKEGLNNFLVDNFRKVLANDLQVDIPARLNIDLLKKAQDLHDSLDFWTAPEGIKVIQIAGWGVPATLSSTKYDVKKIRYCDEAVCTNGADALDPDFKFTIDGDGTVVTPSALWMSGVERYWISIAKYNKQHPFETVGGLLGLGHAKILEIPQLESFIIDNISNKTKEISEYKYLSTEVPPSSDEKRLQYSLHSPLTLELVDDKGRRTGINSDGQIEEQIPDTYFKQFGEVKYIFADENISSHVEMKGYANGAFTFAVEEFKGDESLGKVTFKDMPTTPETRVTFDVPSNLESASNLAIDKNGDGSNEFSLKPKIGEVVVFDNIAPTTEASISGIQGSNNWHTSDAILTLSATDNENGAGVAKTEYSLDDGKTFVTYSNPITFTQEGVFEIAYRSVDKQDNIEETKKIAIKIDKTAPEAKLTFNPQAQKLDVIGTDNQSQNVSVAMSEQTILLDNHQDDRKNKSWFWGWFQKEKSKEKKILVTAILTDEVGHKTELVWEKKNIKDRRLNLTISSISYDGIKTNVSGSSLQYKWLQDWRKNKYLLFASHLSNNVTFIETHYLPKQNQTWLMEKPKEIADDDNDDNAQFRPVWKKLTGMVIPGIMTEKGVVKIIY